MRSARVDRRAGVTLAELLVVIVILGLTAGVAGMAGSALRAPPESDLAGTIRRQRAAAIRLGVPQMALIPLDGPERSPTVIRFLPDGRVLGPGIDQWTGALRLAKEDSTP